MTPYVNHGRWVVDCPDPYCPGAAFAADRFDCANCGRAGFVDWPEDKLLADAVLSLRPVPETRNWKPWEQPVSELVKENLVMLGGN